MSIDRLDAKTALDAVARSQQQAGELKNYASAGSILMAWGIAWLAGNLASQIDPSWARIVWPLANAGAVLWSILRPGGRFDRRAFATAIAIAGYVLLTLTLVRPDPRLANVLVSLMVAASYVVLGIWTGYRFALLGLILVAIILTGWFLVPSWLFACMAFGGGGTLLVGGWWLHRA